MALIYPTRSTRMKNGFIDGVFESIVGGTRALARRSPRKAAANLGAMCNVLLSSRGEASGVALAREILDAWHGLGAEGRKAFLLMLAQQFGPDPQRLDRAIHEYRKRAEPRALVELHEAAEPRRQELFRRFNLAPGGTAALVALRQ